MITKALRGINFSKGVNVSSKLSTNSGNRLSTKLQKNHQNQEKAFVWCQLVISSFRHFVTSQLVWGMINRGSTVKNILYIFIIFIIIYLL